MTRPAAPRPPGTGAAGKGWTKERALKKLSVALGLAAGLLLLDGTFWSNPELIRLRGIGKTAHEMGHVPRRGEHIALAGLNFVVMHTKGGAVRWFKVSPVAGDDATG